jgi:pyrimidine-nucleoside phosphorylase
MRAVDIITKKRDGGELSPAEIKFFVEGLTSGAIPDYQTAAWLMTVFFRGMTARETTDLTLAMAHSGEVLDLSDTVPLAVDKHSTGGVGDKVTLVVEPLVAAVGVPVGKMSGRGLSFSGGTIDKLESIPGFRTALSVAEFKSQLKQIGVVLTGQSANLAPADGKLYALRDVTGTVNSIPLIASSVMSKKIAGGAQAIVLDVKMGTGAFMPNLKEATKLARAMVAIGQHAQRRVVAVISDMNQPLGHAVGNALEVKEAIDTLQGGGPADFREHCLDMGAHLLMLAGKARTRPAARAILSAALANGAAWQKFRQLVIAQGGDVGVVDDPGRLPQATLIEEVASPESGYLARVDAREVGLSAVELGAGRATKEDAIDHAVGLMIYHKVGERVEAGQPLFAVHANNPDRLAAAITRVLAAHTFSPEPVTPLPLFYKVLKSKAPRAMRLLA